MVGQRKDILTTVQTQQWFSDRRSRIRGYIYHFSYITRHKTGNLTRQFVLWEPCHNTGYQVHALNVGLFLSKNLVHMHNMEQSIADHEEEATHVHKGNWEWWPIRQLDYHVPLILLHFSILTQPRWYLGLDSIEILSQFNESKCSKNIIS